MEIKKYVSALALFDVVDAIQFNGDMYELAVLIPGVVLLSGTEGVATIYLNNNTMKLHLNDYLIMYEDVAFVLDSKTMSVLYKEGGEQ